MTAVPANASVNLEFQDNRGYRALVKLNNFIPDISDAGGATLTSSLWTMVANVAAAVAAASNSKLIRAGWSFDADYAQEPSSETGTYELVIQKARLDWGDGNGGFAHTSIPAPKDAIFLTSADNNLVVVNPTATGVTGIQTAMAALFGGSPRGGVPCSQFFGGQLVQGKPRIRRVLQGA